MTLFKYTTPDICIKILEKGLIRFTQPLSFNDPFDCSPVIQKIYDEKSLTKIFNIALSNNKSEIEKVLINSFDETIKKINPELVAQLTNKEKIKYFYENMYKEAIDINEFVVKNLDRKKFKETSINGFIQNIALRTGVFSMTKNPTNLLMWAHYANSHSGFVLEFDVSNPFFRTIDNEIYPPYIEVKYDNRRPIINADLFNITKEKLFQYFESIFFTKSIEWVYEGEVRILRQLSEKTDSGIQDLYGYPIHLFPFPKHSLKSVIIGNRAKQEDIQRVWDLLYKNFNDVLVYYSELDKLEFKLNLKQG